MGFAVVFMIIAGSVGYGFLYLTFVAPLSAVSQKDQVFQRSKLL